MMSIKFVFCFFALIAISNCYVLDNVQYYESVDDENSPIIQTYPEEALGQRVKRQDRGSASIGLQQNRQNGVNLNAEAQARLWRSQNGRSQLDANANYNRQLSGPGRGRPNYGAGVMFTHRF